MAFNIPLPEAPDVALRQSIGQGANLYNMLVNHAMERAKGRIAEAANARAEKMQPYTIKQMLSQMANSSAANARQQALLNPRLESYRLAAEKARNEANPDYAFNKMTHDYERLQKYMQSRKSGNQPANEPNNNAALQQKLAQTGMFGLPGQPAAEDRGYSVPSDMPEEQMQGVVPMGQPQAAGAVSSPDDELARNFLGAGFKKEYGFNPYEPAKETPQEKDARNLELFKKKEEMKAQRETAMPPAIKTLHENIIHLSPKAIKAIDHIIAIPSPLQPWGLGVIKSGQKAAHNKAVTAAAENFSKANGWPNTKGSIEKAESILQRGHLETDYDYHKRLRGYQEDLREGIKTSNEFMHPNQKSTSASSDNNIIEYVRVNGKLVPKSKELS